MPLPEAFHKLARELCNWGRWGPDDQIGTLNLIDDAAVRRGADAIVTGERLSLALPLSSAGPQAGLIPGRDNPTHRMTQVHHSMTGDPSAMCSSDGVLEMGLQVATHWDALSHVSYDGRVYNGHDPATISASGAASLGIERVGPIAGRAILLDIARARGEDALPAGHAITGDDLDRAEEHAGVQVLPGDIVLVRTGQMRRFHEGDRVAYAFPSAGLSMQSAPWLRARDVAAVATDNLTFEVFPGERDDALLPVHLLHLVEMGLTQGQNFDLEALGSACAGDGRHAMLLVAAPEPVVGGTGAPVVPVAIR